MATTSPATGFCAQCGRQARVSEPYAFFGADRLRATLACGHVVVRADAGLDAEGVA